jgi:hypothetical protein
MYWPQDVKAEAAKCSDKKFDPTGIKNSPGLTAIR